MPKITAIDAKTGQPSGEVQMGRAIKAQTNATPSPIEHVAQKAALAAPPTPVEGQPNKSEGSNQEATQIDPKYEALARKESAFRNREREFQAKEAALESRVKSAVEEALKQYKGQLKQSPLDVLNGEGVTYDQLVEQAMNAPSPETRAIHQKLQSIEDAQRKLAEDSQNSAKAQRDAAVKQIRYDIDELIQTDPQFETIKHTGSADDVQELITRTFDETGRLMTVEQAAKAVEDELFEEAIKIASLSKVKAKSAPALTPDLVTQTKQQPNQQQPITTLTNNMTSTRPMSARERAIMVFKGEKL